MSSLYVLLFCIVSFCSDSVSSEFEREKRSPNFDSEETKIIPVIEGRAVALDCLVHNLGHKRPIVKWLRVRDSKILAIGSNLRINNPRFRAYYNEDSSRVWTLEIFKVGPEDEGEYECQVSTDKPLSTITKKFNIVVERLPMLILGGRNQVFEQGSTIELNCIFTIRPQFKTEGFWFRTVNRSPMQVLEIENLEAREIVQTDPVMRSTLVIPNASVDKEGEYLCKPDNKWVTWVAVKVVPEGILTSRSISKSSRQLSGRDNWFYAALLTLAFFIFSKNS